MTAQGFDKYGPEAIYSVGASVGLSESSNMKTLHKPTVARADSCRQKVWW